MTLTRCAPLPVLPAIAPTGKVHDIRTGSGHDGISRDQQTRTPPTSIEAQGHRGVGRQVLALWLQRCAGAVPPTRHAVAAQACRTEEEGPLIDRLTSQRGKRRQCWPVPAVLELRGDHGSAGHGVERQPQASRNERRDCVMVRAAAGSVPAACPAMVMLARSMSGPNMAHSIPLPELVHPSSTGTMMRGQAMR